MRSSLQTVLHALQSRRGRRCTGIALGAALLGLPWRVTGVKLAGDCTYYDGQAAALTAAFGAAHGFTVDAADLPLAWVDRRHPRRFGRVLEGEVAACRDVARAHGVLLDPIYSLAAWEAAADLAADGGECVAMLHAGGGLALQPRSAVPEPILGGRASVRRTAYHTCCSSQTQITPPDTAASLQL